jgi:hypothetical protein
VPRGCGAAGVLAQLEACGALGRGRRLARCGSSSLEVAAGEVSRSSLGRSGVGALGEAGQEWWGRVDGGVGRRRADLARCHTCFPKRNQVHLICASGSVYTHMIDKMSEISFTIFKRFSKFNHLLHSRGRLEGL